MRQPTIRQILEWKQRRGDSPRYGQELIVQITNLQKLIAQSDLAILSDFVPIKLATIFEVFVREFVRELVDSGDPYLDRAVKQSKLNKIDISFVKNIDRNSLTIGDLIAHSISTNAIDNVIAVFEGLIPGFKAKLAEIHPRWTEEEPNWPTTKIIGDVDAVITQLKRLLEVRHVITHELPEKSVYGEEELSGFFTSLMLFIEACDWIAVKELHGSVPSTQSQMNLDAGGALQEAEKELLEVSETLKPLLGFPTELWGECQEAWRVFAHQQAKVIASQVEGGSMYGAVFASAMEELVSDRIEQIMEMPDQWMEQ